MQLIQIHVRQRSPTLGVRRVVQSPPPFVGLTPLQALHVVTLLVAGGSDVKGSPTHLVSRMWGALVRTEAAGETGQERSELNANAGTTSGTQYNAVPVTRHQDQPVAVGSMEWLHRKETSATALLPARCN